MEQNDKIIIGRKDKADFPGLGIRNLDVKIDTGAYTSSIHCNDILVEKIGKKKVLTFQVLDPEHRKFSDKRQEFKAFRTKTIKSSNGMAEERYVVRTSIKLFGKIIHADFSLTSRGEMRFPVLLGRNLIQGHFIVDPELINLSYKHKKDTKPKS